LAAAERGCLQTGFEIFQIKQRIGLLLRDRTAPARIPATISASVGLAALIGWTFNVPALIRVLPGAVEMKANTAACAVLCGTALWIVAGDASPGRIRLARVLSLCVMLIALTTLAEYVVGWNSGIDELLVKDSANAYNLFRGRMSPISAAAFTAIAGALTALPYRRVHGAVTWAAAGAVVAGLVSLLGYLWNAVEIVTDRFLPPVAFNTASCLALLGTGILLCPGKTGADAAGKFTALAALETKILAGFIVALSLLLAGGTYTYRTTVRVAAAADSVAHTQEVRAALASLYGSLAGAEVAQRDFVLTSESRHRDAYERSIQDVQLQLGNLLRLTADNAEQRQNVDALAAMARERGTNSILEVRELTDRMAAIEGRLLAARQAAMIKVRETTLVSLLATLAVACGVFTALFRGIRREMLARSRSESDLREANRFLDSLIENLPVMIALKDADSLRYVRVNRAVERFLGVSRSQLIGRSVHDLLPAEEAAPIIASDRQALECAGVVDNPEQRVHTASLGLRIFHTMKMPICDPGGRPRYVLSISTDITERKLAEQAIQELNSALVSRAEQLTASNRELESFSYSVSHDLRAPLRAIDGFAQMLEEDYGARLDAEGLRYLGVIRANTQRLGALIDDLLELSRLGRLPVSAQEINVESLVREVVAEALDGRPTAPRVAIGSLPPVRGDRTLLRQVWTNLIANAIKYSGKAAEPRIEVSGRQDAAENVYSVRDNGVGFNMEYADKLFGVFQRLHRADEFSGTGVGLAIVQRVVARHGGRVWADGKVNGGAMFSFSLPVQVSDE
jgi:PAS domain S-box-containing protein